MRDPDQPLSRSTHRTPVLYRATMANSSADAAIRFFSTLMAQGYAGDFSAPVSDLTHLYPQLERVTGLSEKEFGEWLSLADTHHVTIRSLVVLERIAREQHKKRMVEWCEAALEVERARTSPAVEWLYGVVQALELSGCRVCVIKSLDHWPDLGTDLDLYTSGTPEQVIPAMRERLRADLEPRSWGDRLASKWNFKVPGLRESVEIHVQRLGQTGEHTALARRFVTRRVQREIGGYRFLVPAAEERVMVATLQRMYRHFYFRICDICNTARLIDDDTIGYAELESAAKQGGIWPGVATYLKIVADYAGQYRGIELPLPKRVAGAAMFGAERISVRTKFLRVPMMPEGAKLYTREVKTMALKGNVPATFRLSLLPPLASAAAIAYKITGSDKGVW